MPMEINRLCITFSTNHIPSLKTTLMFSHTFISRFIASALPAVRSSRLNSHQANSGGLARRLAVSDCYIGPLFRGILDRAWRESGGERMPRLASDWNTLEGWAAGGRQVPVVPADAAEFAEALAQLSPADVAEHCAGCTVEECLRSAAVVREFPRPLLRENP